MFTKVMSVIGWTVVVAAVVTAITLLIMYNVKVDIGTIFGVKVSVPLIELHPEVKNVVEAVGAWFM